MATVNKNFRIKNGLIVEGTSGTINGQNILTETGSDQYILDLIGGENLIDTVAAGLSVDGNSQLSIDRTVVDTWYDANGAAAAALSDAQDYADTAEADAISTASADATSKANAAQAAAEATASADATSKANAAQAAAEATASADATSKANAAQAAAEATASADATSKANAAQAAAEADATSKANAAQAAAEATASADATSKANAAQAAAEATASADATTKANAAQAAAEGYADGLAVNYDAAGSAAAAQTAAEGFATQAIANLVDSAPATLDTLNELAAALQDNPDIISDLQDIAAGKQDTLTAGSNIDITGSTISVTGLSTDDVAEDAGNKYFTDQRALDATAAAYDVVGSAAGSLEQANDYTDGEITTALTTAQGYANTAEQNAEATAQGALDDVLDGTTTFTAINVNSLAKEVAVTATVSTASTATALTWDTEVHRTVKALVKFATASHTEVSEVLLTLDGSNNIAITEYAIVGTNGSMGTVTATIVAGEGRLNVTTLNPATVVFVKATLLV